MRLSLCDFSSYGTDGYEVKVARRLLKIQITMPVVDTSTR